MLGVPFFAVAVNAPFTVGSKLLDRVETCACATKRQGSTLHLRQIGRRCFQYELRNSVFNTNFTFSSRRDRRSQSSMSRFIIFCNVDASSASCGLAERIQTIESEGRKHNESLSSTKVVVGMSGGVDSSTVAGVLRRDGYDIVGVTLWHLTGEGSCCSGGMVDAARICDQLGVEHHIVDTREEFTTNVVEYLVQGYQSGITPLACSQCNKTVKFRGLLDFADANGLLNVATGHYARIEYDQSSNRHVLKRALYLPKDQSYFLYDLSQDQLARLIFPLGSTTKTETREEARNMGLYTADKPESQDLCLAEKHGSMRAFLEEHIDARMGAIIDQEGNVLGQHSGVHNFTIGQRKGLRVAADLPLYVIELKADTNEVVVCKDRSTALSPDCTVQRVNWVSIPPQTEPFKATVQLRYRSPPVVATVIPLQAWAVGESRVRIVFDNPQFAVAPGQAAVFYDEDKVLGGGIIERPVVV
mmetsp:Transcript_9964/g.16937  ORF Transcript_9964/g.16937 Transcript_9964/m.16937 type:complete len:472 (+) Transcript_9964:30-1445(+)